MKKWMKPEAVVQQFVANDYVAACSTHYVFDCNVPAEGGRIAAPAGGFDCLVEGQVVHFANALYFSPCGTHYAEKATSGFSPYTFTQYKADGVIRNLDKPINGYVWYQYSDESHSYITRIHATTNTDVSSWETTKS